MIRWKVINKESPFYGQTCVEIDHNTQGDVRARLEEGTSTAWFKRDELEEIRDKPAPVEPIVAMCEYKGTLFVATSSGLYRLVTTRECTDKPATRRLERVPFEGEPAP